MTPTLSLNPSPEPNPNPNPNPNPDPNPNSQVYQLERSRADALTIEGLQRDVHALIRDKQQLSEENLKLRSTIAAIPLGRRALA